MSPETPFKNMPFGFNSSEDFTQCVREYITELKKDSSRITEEDLNDPNENYRKGITFILKSHQQEVIFLEEKLSEPDTFYVNILSIYDRIVGLEDSGKSKVDIVNEFLDTDEEGVMAVLNLLEHGIGQDWGYHFIQPFTALRARRRASSMSKMSKAKKTKE